MPETLLETNCLESRYIFKWDSTTEVKFQWKLNKQYEIQFVETLTKVIYKLSVSDNFCSVVVSPHCR